ncbi:UNVERIFIED_CONTAM: hypothetical protein GTU68_057478 [Idotea baltica]|nr:hypothetical protein [Idotea baltica]
MLQQFDPRNEDIQIWVGDRLWPRAEAKVSVFDSVVQGGDGVWEGIRVYAEGIFSLDRHLQRMEDSAHTLGFKGVPSRESIKEAIFATLKANGMDKDVHIRLTLSRGGKTTSGMDPRLNQFGCCLIVVAEWKPPVYDKTGISLVTSAIRRNSPVFLDSKIHHNNLLNNILAKMEANFAGVDDALMLDANGFVAETNATNVFFFRHGALYTPHPDACLPGITRGIVLELAREAGMEVVERNLSVSEFYNADEVFVTGTMGELAKVTAIDGRSISNRSGARGMSILEHAFTERIRANCVPLPA